MTLERRPASGGLRLRAVAVRYAHKRADSKIKADKKLLAGSVPARSQLSASRNFHS
ncbi:hypothetical protein J7431_05770 [Xanthomonas phaseoli pv. dieffenbachiae]|uniref:hypothetical protein n=1 Tax=Xanthomonas TaxID=338 RepID=UPI000A409B83|nr:MULTISPECIES: hypothetical protein [Xanthomonas]MBO9746793.1 hypothetical protein [Xanthomonas phaseoli pv. dieffenbachiae]MBO9753553.1 hypothetical protein [Xanthomonas phaseoli pv. dieffenbachiae]MBO9891679.1 hypothetical protein [Xanthomonas sp. D-36-1]